MENKFYNNRQVICLFFSDAEITGWTNPVISGKNGSGNLTVNGSQAPSVKITTFAATSKANSITYSLVNAVTPFNVSENGDLTITSSLNAQPSTYTLTVK